MEYCSHLWDSSAKYQLDALDSVDRRARRLIGNDLVISRLQTALNTGARLGCLSGCILQDTFRRVCSGAIRVGQTISFLPSNCEVPK
ncbi:jg4588 [Pararge aegeria aegeria]|uniref:Jg4588 protein n=1 Tax=Pararge aegeria aegeria TaxID=348720 RepID=A0A8S4R1F7_9NEOP|nr:jg4588 [Pararge aegeria aegeria]